jgi:hypothetical protein
MVKKHVLIGAAMAFLLVGQTAYAPRYLFSGTRYTGNAFVQIEEQRKSLERRVEEARKKEELVNYRTQNFWEDSLDRLIARLLLGEAEGCSEIEKTGIVWTAITRSTDENPNNGETLRNSILWPYQYSAFNEDRNQKLKRPLEYNAGEFLANLPLAKEILAGKHKDPTNGATHYFNPNHPDLNGKYPDWAKDIDLYRIVVGMTKERRPIYSIHIFGKPKKNNFIL